MAYRPSSAHGALGSKHLMDKTFRNGIYTHTASEWIPFLLLGTISGVVPLAFAVQALIPDEFNVTLPAWGVGLGIFGLFNIIFLQALFIRKVEVRGHILKLTSPIPLLNQRFDLSEVDDVRLKSIGPRTIPFIELHYKGRWHVLWANSSFLNSLTKA